MLNMPFNVERAADYWYDIASCNRDMKLQIKLNLQVTILILHNVHLVFMI
jgi:hypothetical protein